MKMFEVLTMVFTILIMVLCCFVGISESSCAGSDPGFSSDFHPAVTRVSATRVMVQWTKSHVENIDCGDNFIVKYWPVDKPEAWKMSRLLPLRVFENIVTKSFNYTQNNETFTYLVAGLDGHNSYSIQIAVTENRAIMGRSWYRSSSTIVPKMNLKFVTDKEAIGDCDNCHRKMEPVPKVVVTENRSIIGRSWYRSASAEVSRMHYNSVKAQEEVIDRTMLIVVAIIVLLAILLILVGTAYNIHKCVTAKNRDWETESDDVDYDDYQMVGAGADLEPPAPFGNLNGNPFLPPATKYVFQQQNDPEIGRQESTQSGKYRDAMHGAALAYMLKNGQLNRKAIRDVLAPRHNQMASRTGTRTMRVRGQAGKGGLTGRKQRPVGCKRAPVLSVRKDKLSYRKDRLPAKKGVLSSRAIRKLYQQNPGAARLMAGGAVVATAPTS